MQLEIQKSVRSFAENGIPLAEAMIALPHSQEDSTAAQRVNRFYTRLGDGIVRIAEKLLAPRSLARYTASEDPRRRFTHRPYRIEMIATLTEDGNTTKITRTLTLSHRGRPLYRETVAERILPDGRFLSVSSKGRK